MSGYDHARVRAFLQAHGTVRPEDGRVMRLNRHSLPESLRNTLANWQANELAIAPLGRWDEILMSVDMMIWEYEQWELDRYGDLSYTECGDTPPPNNQE